MPKPRKIKYVIVSIYDAGWQFTVCRNGEIVNKSDFYRKYDYSPKNTFYDFLLRRFPTYDLIIVCEDGEVKVLQDNSRKDEE